MAVAQDEMLTFLEEELPVIDGITSTETFGLLRITSWATSGSCGRKPAAIPQSGRGVRAPRAPSKSSLMQLSFPCHFR